MTSDITIINHWHTKDVIEGCKNGVNEPAWNDGSQEVVGPLLDPVISVDSNRAGATSEVFLSCWDA
jgi:hypothetical protein